MVFTVTEFLKSPSVEVFDALNKDELIELGSHFGLGVKSSMRKQEIRNTVAKKFLDEGIFETYDLAEEVEHLKLGGKMSEYEFQLQLEKMKLEREREKEKLQFERERAQEKLQFEREREERQFQLEKLRIESGESQSVSSDHLPFRSEFDAAKNIRLVPKFQEKSVDKYFAQFEKVAENLKWPHNVWSTLLQSVLVGKAAEVYSALSVAESSDYDKVKAAILQAYELVPEAYRQKFRNYKKFDNQTFVEFAREKEDLFDQWFRSRKLEKNLRSVYLKI